jgi:lipopolysaccharide biosynthesis glycosyltransferase
MAAFVYEDESVTSYYQKNLTYPYYGRVGLNTGIGLFNLTRMRAFEFSKKIFAIFSAYKRHNLKYGDQCLLNILFHFNPGWTLIFFRRQPNSFNI